MLCAGTLFEFCGPRCFVVERSRKCVPGGRKKWVIISGEVMEKFTIICPCCESTISVDSQTGSVLSHEERKKVHGSFEDLKGELSKQKELRDQLFAQEMSSMKDRERLLEEKFREALKKADTSSDKPFRNPLDLD